MQLFLSWSGQRSRLSAEIIGKFIKMLVHSSQPWMSTDILKGARWSREIAERLERSRVGILCLTPENLKSEWIMFEAGAVAKASDNSVCTFLLDVSHADVSQPIAQFQHTEFQKGDVLRLVKTVSSRAADDGGPVLADSELESLFEALWPTFRAQMEGVIGMSVGEKKPERMEREILEEILATVRALQGLAAGVRVSGSPTARQDSVVGTSDWEMDLGGEPLPANIKGIGQSLARRVVKERVEEARQPQSLVDMSQGTSQE